MKKLSVILAAAAIGSTIAAACMLLSFTEAPRKVSTMTRFEGKSITGVAASSAFDVKLVASSATKAVVEIDEELEKYLVFTRDSRGVVTVGLENAPSRGLSLGSRTLRLTLHLPAVQTIRLSGATDLTSTGNLAAESVDIMLSGASDVKQLDLSGSRGVKLQCSGASDVRLTLNSVQSLIVMASGSSDVHIAGEGIRESKIAASGASDVTLIGTGTCGEWSASGSSDLKCKGFELKQGAVTATGSSDVWVKASSELTLRASGGSDVWADCPGDLSIVASGGADVRYHGKPYQVNVSGGATAKRL